MYEEILTRIKTQEDKDRLIGEIENLLTALYETRTDANFESLLKHKVRKWFADILREAFTDSQIDRQSYLQKLKKEVEKMPTVGLTLAFEPTQEIVDVIKALISQSVGENVILNLNVDPKIIGGVQVVYKGNFRDFTFNTIFEKEFEENRQRFLNSLDLK